MSCSMISICSDVSPRMRSMGAVAARNASLRSVWLINSLRGALALAVAVAVADLSGVQHAFWVALGTLSVLRTGAAATGATALRALAGTVAGFVIGSVVILAIGSDPAVLWAMLPVSVFVAAYCSCKAPVAAGQAAFTVYIAVLFNLIVPVGWKVGVVRIEDVALGCAVSVLVGVLMWPRGAVRVVADDLADAFQQGASYLAESMDWILGRSPVRPAGGLATVAAGIRLDGALRGLLAEQGTKHIPKEHLWRLVGATMRRRGQWRFIHGTSASRGRPSGGCAAPASAESWRRWRAVSGCSHISVFIAGASTTGRAGSQARQTQVRQVSARPFASFASVLASSGATSNSSAQRRRSMCSTGSSRW